MDFILPDLSQTHYAECSASVIAGLHRHTEFKRSAGSFVEALLANDLRGACMYADDHNVRIITMYVTYMMNHLPAACWGSSEAVRAWRVSGTCVTFDGTYWVRT